jgi:hypothetical protein
VTRGHDSLSLDARRFQRSCSSFRVRGGAWTQTRVIRSEMMAY